MVRSAPLTCRCRPLAPIGVRWGTDMRNAASIEAAKFVARAEWLGPVALLGRIEPVHADIRLPLGRLREALLVTVC